MGAEESAAADDGGGDYEDPYELPNMTMGPVVGLMMLNGFLMTSHSCDRSSSLPSKMTAPYMQGIRHLLDDSVLEESPSVSSQGSFTSSVDAKDFDTVSEDQMQASFWSARDNLAADVSSIEDIPKFQAMYTCEGCLKRKTLLKNKKKPTVSSWTRYWVALWGTSLLYYPAKTFRGDCRTDFKHNPSKMTSIVGWMVVMGDNPVQPDAFTLLDPVKGNQYKFRAGTQAKALEWCKALSSASKSEDKKAPQNLMSFE